LNAKTQRPGVCNACESLLVDSAKASEFVPPIVSALLSAGVTVHADDQALSALEGLEFPLFKGVARSAGGCTAKVIPATPEDWGREYLDLEISLKCVSGLEEAIAHINRYSTHHSEAIISQDYAACQRFQQAVDSACVYVNASTRFSDGGEFGLGAEIGISTQKLHARGPMGAAALTSTKYLISGSGQTRA
jgi:glutamate-5-semialdehyde dehydrogenase